MMIVPVHEIVLPSGEVNYQCTRCWGVYNTKGQAETVDLHASNGKRQAHRCRAGPFRER